MIVTYCLLPHKFFVDVSGPGLRGCIEKINACAVISDEKQNLPNESV